MRTLVWTAAVVFGTVLVSVPVALILNTEFYGRGIARVIVMLPWSVSLTMMAIVWRWALNGESGLLNLTLQDLGLIDQKVVWLASAATAFPIQILIGILVSVPFTVTIFLGGLSSIPSDIYEAASTDGASSWQRFRTLTLPLMRPFINMAVVLNIIYVFNSFPIIWVLTGGGPSDLDADPGHLPVQAGLHAREDGRGGVDLADHVRHPAGLHPGLSAHGDEGRARWLGTGHDWQRRWAGCRQPPNCHPRA